MAFVLVKNVSGGILKPTESARALSRSIPSRSRAFLCSLACGYSDAEHVAVVEHRRLTES